jgi:hypothetical protein
VGGGRETCGGDRRAPTAKGRRDGEGKGRARFFLDTFAIDRS